MLITKIEVEIWSNTAALNFYSGELWTTFSKNIGAKDKFLATLFKWDYFLKMITGKEKFIMLFLWRMLDPIFEIMYLKTFFWTLICSSSVHKTPPFLWIFHYLNKGCYLRNRYGDFYVGCNINFWLKKLVLQFFFSYILYLFVFSYIYTLFKDGP